MIHRCLTPHMFAFIETVSVVSPQSPGIDRDEVTKKQKFEVIKMEELERQRRVHEIEATKLESLTERRKSTNDAILQCNKEQQRRVDDSTKVEAMDSGERDTQRAIEAAEKERLRRIGTNNAVDAASWAERIRSVHEVEILTQAEQARRVSVKKDNDILIPTVKVVVDEKGVHARGNVKNVILNPLQVTSMEPLEDKTNSQDGSCCGCCSIS